MINTQKEILEEIKEIKQLIKEEQVQAAERCLKGADIIAEEGRFMCFYKQQMQAIRAAYDLYFTAM